MKRRGIKIHNKEKEKGTLLGNIGIVKWKQQEKKWGKESKTTKKKKKKKNPYHNSSLGVEELSKK